MDTLVTYNLMGLAPRNLKLYFKFKLQVNLLVVESVEVESAFSHLAFGFLCLLASTCVSFRIIDPLLTSFALRSSCGLLAP